MRLHCIFYASSPKLIVELIKDVPIDITTSFAVHRPLIGSPLPPINLLGFEVPVPMPRSMLYCLLYESVSIKLSSHFVQGGTAKSVEWIPTISRTDISVEGSRLSIMLKVSHLWIFSLVF